ncbi:hypothetical protein PHMEG_0008570 [Phytophthora megakarya]|uniref:Bzip transcription factor n=1 Tax=Phytophthora megakarya TaxID=4795 RepID=A0A225WID8_9STRA|nr:hypothetical protein PHMEG_0008570 [Phytophthora megakarya]
MRFFQVYQYGYSVSMAPLQEHFLRSILDADVEGADFRRPDAFVQQWRLNGQHFAVYVLEPQGWKTHTVDGSVMVTVEVMLYLRFLRQTIGTLFPTLKSGAVHFEFVQPLTTGTTAVLATYSFIVNTRGKITSLLTNLQLLESLRRVLRSLDNVVRLTEGTRIALDSGTIRLE